MEKESQAVTGFVETLANRGSLLVGVILLAALFLVLPLVVGDYSSWAKSDLSTRELTLFLPAYGEFQVNEGDDVKLELVAMDAAHELNIEGVGSRLVLPGQVQMWEFIAPAAGVLSIQCADGTHGMINVTPEPLQRSLLLSIAEHWSVIPFAIVGLAFVYTARRERLL